MNFETLTGKEFFALIPTGLEDNIRFRIDFHKLASQSKDLQQWFLETCRDYLPVMFNALFWTLNPRKPPSESLKPFILRPKQIFAVEKIDQCIKIGKDVGIDKAREEGATEIVSKIYAAHSILYKKRNFIVGSRTKKLVDTIGDDYTIFAKIDNAFEYLPSWMGLNVNNGSIYRKDMLLRVVPNSSTINGETTNESFSAGSRGTSMLLDEFGRVDKYIADSIEGSIHDVTDCVIYNSTHWLGLNHTFNQVLHRPGLEIITFDWWENPDGKNQGLYTSNSPGEVELIDIEYYQKNYPELLKYAES